jgi:hypothetical protein
MKILIASVALLVGCSGADPVSLIADAAPDLRGATGMQGVPGQNGMNGEGGATGMQGTPGAPGASASLASFITCQGVISSYLSFLDPSQSCSANCITNEGQPYDGCVFDETDAGTIYTQTYGSFYFTYTANRYETGLVDANLSLIGAYQTPYNQTPQSYFGTQTFVPRSEDYPNCGVSVMMDSLSSEWTIANMYVGFDWNTSTIQVAYIDATLSDYCGVDNGMDATRASSPIDWQFQVPVNGTLTPSAATPFGYVQVSCEFASVDDAGYPFQLDGGLGD